MKSLSILTYLLTYLLTPWCRVLPEQLTGLQLVKKFPTFHGTRRFITAITNVRHLSLSWTSPIQSIYPHPTSCRSILILYTHLRLGLPSGSFPPVSPPRLYTPPSPHPYVHTPSPSHSSRFYHPHNIGWGRYQYLFYRNVFGKFSRLCGAWPSDSWTEVSLRAYSVRQWVIVLYMWKLHEGLLMGTVMKLFPLIFIGNSPCILKPRVRMIQFYLICS